MVAVCVPPSVELVELVEHLGQELLVACFTVNVHCTPCCNRRFGVTPVVISLVESDIVRNHSVLCLMVEESPHLVFCHLRVVEDICRSDFPCIPGPDTGKESVE